MGLRRKETVYNFLYFNGAQNVCRRERKKNPQATIKKEKRLALKKIQTFVRCPSICKVILD